MGYDQHHPHTKSGGLVATIVIAVGLFVLLGIAVGGFVLFSNTTASHESAALAHETAAMEQMKMHQIDASEAAASGSTSVTAVPPWSLRRHSTSLSIPTEISSVSKRRSPSKTSNRNSRRKSRITASPQP